MGATNPDGRRAGTARARVNEVEVVKSAVLVAEAGLLGPGRNIARVGPGEEEGDRVPGFVAGVDA